MVRGKFVLILREGRPEIEEHSLDSLPDLDVPILQVCNTKEEAEQKKREEIERSRPRWI